MHTYRITLQGRYVGRADVKASFPGVAVKRLLDGGHERGYTIATTSPHSADRIKLGRGDRLTITVERID